MDIIYYDSVHREIIVTGCETFLLKPSRNYIVKLMGYWHVDVFSNDGLHFFQELKETIALHSITAYYIKDNKEVCREC